MFEIISVAIAMVAGIYVIMPLFSAQDSHLTLTSAQNIKLSDLLYQKRLIEDTIKDLDFDFQTGKLAVEDYENLLRAQQHVLTNLSAEIPFVTAGWHKNEAVKKLEAEIELAKKTLPSAFSGKCVQCGRAYHHDDKFCSGCGKKIV